MPDKNQSNAWWKSMTENLTHQDLVQRIRELEEALSSEHEDRKILEKRLEVLTRPIDLEKDIGFEDLFDIAEIQRLQDQFANASGVASIITLPSGEPITKPSNFCRLCEDIIRKTETGLCNCYRSDAEIGRLNIGGPVTKLCASGGLWDSGAGISIGGRHIANWLMGQVRDEKQTEEHIRAYARKIGSDEEETVKAYHEVPSMSKEQFENITNFLFTLANQLSLMAFHNIQQARVIDELERSKDSLRRSEAHYRTLIEAIPDLVWAKDQKGAFICCNHALERLLGADESEIIGKTDYDFVDRETADSFRLYDQQAMQQNVPSINEEWLTFASDSYHGLFETIKTSMRDAEGKLIGVMGIARDITKIKQKEEELRQIFDMSLDMICVVDHEKEKFVKVNPSVTRILGYSEKEFTAGSIYDFIHPDDVEGTVSIVRNELRQGTPILKYNNRFICKDGQTRWLSWMSYPEPETGMTFALARDMTEELAISRALEESEQRLRSVVESSPMGIHIFDLQPDGRLVLTDTNTSAEQILGVAAKDVIGLTIEEAFPQIANTEIPQIYKKICRNGQSWNTRQVNYQDEKISGAYEVHAFRAGKNRVAVYFLDITARLVAEKEREILQEKLAHSQKMDAIGQLAGGVAHDFNNMLAGIKGATDLIALTIGDDPKTAKYLALINNAVDRTAGLINKLLAFGRKGKQYSSPVDLHTILKDALAILERSIDKKIIIETKLQAESYEVIGDPAQLQNSFLNLFINARDAMPDGGVLHVSTLNVSAEATKRSADGNPGPEQHILILVQDTGTGIAAETLPHIFDPFFTTKETGKGTGLGLAAVYGAIKDHMGEINVYSELGIGTVFKISLPTTNSRHASIVSNVREEIVHGHGTILIVDDEEIIRTTGMLMLEQLGYGVMMAENGQAAIQLYKDNMTAIDLVILDVIMPVMDGKETFRLLRGLNPDVPIIVSSGFAKDFSMSDMLQDGHSGFLMKPFNSAEMSRLIAKMLM